MAKNQPSYFYPDSAQSAELRDLVATGNGFFHISAHRIPSIIPLELRSKWDSAVVVISASTGPNGAMAVVGHRIDIKVGMMDHDPFLIPVSASTPIGKGVLIHHASFPGRSLPLPNYCVSGLSSLGGANYFKDRPPFGLSSGSTDQLPAPLFQAFDIAQRALSSTSAA